MQANEPVIKSCFFRVVKYQMSQDSLVRVNINWLEFHLYYQHFVPSL